MRAKPPLRTRHWTAISVLLIALIATFAVQAAAPDPSSAQNPDAIESPCFFRTPESLGDQLSVTILPENIEAFQQLLNHEVETARSIEDFFGYTIPRSAKEDFSASFVFESDADTCTVTGKISLSGDWQDHLGIRELGNDEVAVQPSLDVTLDNGIGQFRRFKLFTSGTKTFSGEILASEIFDALGFLAPRNQVVSVNFLGETYDALMQDKISGELLEVRSRQNGPVLETDERIFWGEFGQLGAPTPQRVRNLNKDFVADNGIAGALIAGTALERLQFSFDNDLITELDNSDRWQLSRSFQPMSLYPVLMLAMGGQHGLALHNRSFYYDPGLGVFEPIYYDGNIMLTPEVWWTEDVLDGLRNSTQTDPRLLVDTSALRDKLDSLREELGSRIGHRHDFAWEVFTSSGYKPSDYVDLVIDNILSYLVALSESSSVDFEQQVKEKPTDWPTEEAVYSVVHVPLSDAILSSGSRIPATSCTGINQCEDITLKKSDLPDLLAARHNDREFVEVSVEDTPVVTLLDQRLGLYTIGSVDFERQGNELSFELHDPDARVVFMQSDLSDVMIKVRSTGALMKNPPAEHEINQFGLTGCVEILHSSISNSTIELVGSACEDGVHIASSSGEGVSISVDQALADAIDIDRSALQINEIQVHIAANDCIDFSDSDISVQRANLTNCGDKIVSIGERATVDILLVEGSGNFGLISKDLAQLKVGIANINTDSRCTDTYQKKEIFGPGNLAVGQLNCSGASPITS